ncbi:MAG TPA: four-carbon acid sugar kinase family protein, partial [Deinococcales bacterium]|nr:four-carbon acid sugar kinase family protein [Deinococcales bacterium]
MTGPRPEPPLMGVVADDLTGAGDIGVLFAKHGLAVRVFTADLDVRELPALLAARAGQGEAGRTDVVVLDTDSRLLPAAEAAARVRAATRALQACGCRRFWKKTCSVFRGNVGVEFDALLDTLGLDFAPAVAAFPRNGRTTVQGRHFVRGVPL